MGESAAFPEGDAGDMVSQGKASLQSGADLDWKAESVGEFVFLETEVPAITVERKAQEEVEW